MYTDMHRKIGSSSIAFCVVLFTLYTGGVPVFAETGGYVPIVGIPGLTNDGTRSLADFFNTAYVVLIGLGALFAVLKISLAGVKYSLSDLISSKSEARNDIYGSLLGLAILLIPYIVLSTINPNLVNLNVLEGGLAPLQLESNKGKAPPVSAQITVDKNLTPNEVEAKKAACLNTPGVTNPQYKKLDDGSFVCVYETKANSDSAEAFLRDQTIPSDVSSRALNASQKRGEQLLFISRAGTDADDLCEQKKGTRGFLPPTGVTPAYMYCGVKATPPI